MSTTADQIPAADVAATIDGHLSAYGEPDAARRADLIARVWAGDGRLVDPPIAGEGHGGISEMAEAVLAHYAGHTFRRTSGVDVHHGAFRYAWELVAPGGEVALAGVDVGELADDGRLSRITGFFGELPAREAA